MFVKTVSVLCLTAVAAFAANATAGLQPGKATIKSAGPLAFGPDGVLFVGDTLGATVVALDTGDGKAGKKATTVEIKGI